MKSVRERVERWERSQIVQRMKTQERRENKVRIYMGRRIERERERQRERERNNDRWQVLEKERSVDRNF